RDRRSPGAPDAWDGRPSPDRWPRFPPRRRMRSSPRSPHPSSRCVPPGASETSMRLTKGKRIPRDDGKELVEWVGQATTGTASVSLARCVAPPGWEEPAQTPAFDELVIVREGTLTLRLGRRQERIGAGEVGLVPRGQRVIYANEGGVPSAYDSVCAPAFLPELAHIETPPPVRDVHVEVAHPAGAR